MRKFALTAAVMAPLTAMAKKSDADAFEKINAETKVVKKTKLSKTSVAAKKVNEVELKDTKSLKKRKVRRTQEHKQPLKARRHLEGEDGDEDEDDEEEDDDNNTNNNNNDNNNETNNDDDDDDAGEGEEEGEEEEEVPTPFKRTQEIAADFPVPADVSESTDPRLLGDDCNGVAVEASKAAYMSALPFANMENTVASACTATKVEARMLNGRRLEGSATWTVTTDMEVTLADNAAVLAANIAATAAEAADDFDFAELLFTQYKAKAETYAAANDGAYDMGDDWSWDDAKDAFKASVAVEEAVVSGGPTGTTSSANGFAIVGAIAAVMAGILA